MLERVMEGELSGIGFQPESGGVGGNSIVGVRAEVGSNKKGGMREVEAYVASSTEDIDSRIENAKPLEVKKVWTPKEDAFFFGKISPEDGKLVREIAKELGRLGKPITRPVLQRVAAGFAAAVLAFSGGTLVNSARAEGNQSSIVSSDVVLPDVLTDEYIKEISKTIWKVELPLPVEEAKYIFENWREKTFGPYEQELRDLGADNEYRIEFGAKMLYAWDNSPELANTVSDDKFQDFLSRSEVVDYVMTGENEDVFCDPDGNPLIWCVNMTEEMKIALGEAFEEFERVGISHPYQSVRNSGFCIYIADRLFPDKRPNLAVVNRFGVIISNMDESSLKGFDLVKDIYIKILLVEPVGVSFFQLYGDALGVYGSPMSGYSLENQETVKDDVAGDIAGCVNERIYTSHSSFYYTKAEEHAEKAYLSLDDPWVERQKELLLAVFDVLGENLLSSLQVGSANDEVLEMKERLQELGYFSSGAELSNQYNSTCEERVKLFQQANGIAVTGVADEQTLLQLYSDAAVVNPN